ncbi:31674_t:CDS:2, partial [Gigaspora margarita]
PNEMAQNKCNINDIYMIDPNLDQPNLPLLTCPLENKEEKEFLQEEVNRILEANVI